MLEQMKEEKEIEKRLQNALLEFVEQGVREPSSEKHIEVIPEAALVLSKLLGY